MNPDNLFRQTITIYNKSSYDGYGRVSFGNGTTTKARIQPKQKRVVTQKGDVLIIEALAYVKSDTTVAEDDKVTFDNKIYRVLAIYKTPNSKGNTEFIRLELVKWV